MRLVATIKIIIACDLPALNSYHEWLDGVLFSSSLMAIKIIADEAVVIPIVVYTENEEPQRTQRW